MSKRNFQITEEGTSYSLPVYQVVDGQGIVEVPGAAQLVDFVRGSKLGTEEVPKRVGTLHEHLLSMMIHDLKFKNKLVPSREGSLVITKLEEALFWMEERQRHREAQGVAGTYQKHNS